MVLMLVLTILAIHFYVLYFVLHFNWAIALQDGLCSSALLTLSVWGIVLIIRNYPTSAAIFLYSLFMAFAVSILSGIAEYYILKWWVGSDDVVYAVWLRHTMPVRFILILIFNSWMATNSALRKNIGTLDARFQQQTDASVLLKEAELFKLRQQLQPHFLYNSLNSINALIMIAPDRAQDMIGKLSDFLRSSVRRESEDFLPVKDELIYIQSYLSIEGIRFGDRLKVNIEEEYTDDAKIPPFLLQPILENAIIFGLYGKTGAVNISFHISLKGQILIISITNPYDPDTLPPKGTGFGLEGVKRRLYLLYARTDLLETREENGLFTTILKIPQLHV